MSTSLAEIFRAPRYAIAPDVLLAPEGARESTVMLVEDGAVAGVAGRAEFARAHPETDIVSLPGLAVMPGFIDAHIHLGQGFGKSIIGGEPSQIWRRIWIPLESRLDPELSHVCAKWMFLEALRGGFTGVVNFAIVNREKTEAIHRAAHETGMRLVSSTGARRWSVGSPRTIRWKRLRKSTRKPGSGRSKMPTSFGCTGRATAIDPDGGAA